MKKLYEIIQSEGWGVGRGWGVGCGLRTSKSGICLDQNWKFEGKRWVVARNLDFFADVINE